MDPSIQPILRLRGGGADYKRKESRKRKFAHLQSEAREGPALTKERVSKKRKPDPSASQRRPPTRVNEKEQIDGEAESEIAPELANEAEVGQDGDQAEEENEQAKKAQRFIVFIGNLPYTATTASITAHFSKVQPSSIRHRIDKETGKSKGFAFLEFAAFDRMKTCLKLYHHSVFDDGESLARKINVELTVGGGGAKSEGRKTKLKEKNGKLSEERRRRAEEEAKVARKKARRKGEEASKGKEKKPVGSAHDEPAAADSGDIHPSRRSRVAA